jgi:predicted metal-dependent phosphoesterase TrpH
LNQPILKKADLHVHTVFSSFRHLKVLRARDSYSDPLRVYERCREAGCDFVAITDHDTIEGALDLLSRRPELEPDVIVGEEVETYFPETGQWVHVNVLDVDEAVHRDAEHLRGNVYELTAYLRSRGLLHFLNHPLQSYRLQKRPERYVEDVLSLFTHVELGNGTLPALQNRAAAAMIEYGRSLGVERFGVGGSDAHGLRHVGAFVTIAEGKDKRSWLAEVSAGRCRVAGREIGLAGMIGEVHAIIGRYYLRLATPEGRRAMEPLNYAAAAGFVPVCATGWPLLLSVGNHLRTLGVSGLVHRSLRRAGRAQPAGLWAPGAWTGEPGG